MIASFNKEVDEILEVLHVDRNDVSDAQAMQLTMVCFLCFDRGVGMGTDRAVHTVQRMAINPQPIVKEIRKPMR